MTQRTEYDPFAKRKTVILFAVILLPCSFITAILCGSVNIPLSELFSSLFENGSITHTIIAQIRIPRAIMVAAIGGLLGLTGAVTQGLFRNPLADPSLIGVTAGATIGAALAIFFAIELMSITGLLYLSMVTIFAFIGGAVAVLLVYKLATKRSDTSITTTSVTTMLLAGIAISAVAGGFTSLLEFFSDSAELRQISLWRMGGFSSASYAKATIASGLCVFILFISPKYSNALNALLLGESEARHLGFDVQRIKLQLIILVALGVGTSVALVGGIAFVGLVVPHIIRLLVGPDHRYLLPLSALGGANLLLIADTLARTVLSPIELPIGLMTVALGVPLFISLLRQREPF